MAAASLGLASASPASADVHLPGVEGATPLGSGHVVALPDQRPTRKRVDGRIGDWRGSLPGFAGVTIYSRGELVYQDHLFDAYGPAADRDAAYFGLLDASGIEQLDPRTHRPTTTTYEFARDSEGYHYGASPFQSQADLLELRVAADRRNVYVLGRLTNMTPSDHPALLLLADTQPGSRDVTIPFGAGIHSSTADLAILLAGGRTEVADLHSGSVTRLGPRSAGVDPAGYMNSIEAAIPRSLIAPAGHLRLAAATGTMGTDGQLAPLPKSGGPARLANVAFRPNEPVEPAFDRRQALALHDGTIDPFFETVDVGALVRGASQRYEPGPGYHARSFTVSPQISEEFMNRGIHREYGVYLPAGFGTHRPWPLVTFLHGTSMNDGPSNHGYAALLPGLFADFGDRGGAIVIVPNDRQPRTPGAEQGNDVGFGDWMGESLVELQTAWADAAATFPLDPNREVLTGYSMGGYGTYELAALMPDRFAAAMPIAGQVSSGDYSGVDFQGCSRLGPPQIPGIDPNTTQLQRGDPCYPTSRPNRTTDPPYEGYGLRHPDPRATNMLKVAANFLDEPLAIFGAFEDENQTHSNNLAAARTLDGLGYRYRMWTFLAEEHESPGIFDEWGGAASYLLGFRRNPNPPEVRFARDMPLEHEVERGTGKVANPNVHLRFASAYWVTDIEPADGRAGHAEIDARSLALPDPPHRVVPEAGGPVSSDQTAPHLRTGAAWETSGSAPAASNAFAATLTGAASVTLDLARMGIATAAPISGRLNSDRALTLVLSGRFRRRPRVTVDGVPVATRRTATSLSLPVPAGRHQIRVG